MSETQQEHWQKASEVFHERAGEYDQWFDNSLLFDIELAAIKDLQTSLLAPKLEVGVGPGRFATELGVSVGIDPAFSPLLLASKRDVNTVQGIGEELPVSNGCAATVYLLFTLCFLAEPKLVLAECHRVLKKKGHLVLGVVPARGSWGKALNAKKEKKHPFYEHASFYEAGQIAQWLEETGFKVVECRSSLFQDPENLREKEPSRPGLDEAAGFCLLVGAKK